MAHNANVARGASCPPPRCHGCGVGIRPARMMDRGVWCALLPSPTRVLPCALRREPRAPPINPFPCPIPGSGGDGDCTVWWWSAVVVCSCVSGMSERRSGASVGCCLCCSCSQPPPRSVWEESERARAPRAYSSPAEVGGPWESQGQEGREGACDCGVVLWSLASKGSISLS